MDQIHQPKTEIEKRHKVIRFGEIYTPANDAAKILYEYVHQRADLKVSRGFIPVGFLSSIKLDEGQPLFLETRAGEDHGKQTGPCFMVSWKAEREVLRGTSEDGWMSNLDDLWTGVLTHFERKGLLSEETLEYLDADPFVLFGIDDSITQQALAKLQKFPALWCRGIAPEFEEWAQYLRVDPVHEGELRWLVQAFAETDLPKPWTCYKGVGSIVCYIHSDSGQVTWKHPFYDYFRQLRDFCRQATPGEVQQVRCNRLLWSYEATRVETEHDQEPLISPEYIGRLADIFGHDIHTSGYLVRNLKAQLKLFAKSYRVSQDISIQEVEDCAKILDRDSEKYYEMREHWEFKVNEEVRFDLTALAQGELRCVECDTTALCFCLECKDYLCLRCYDNLHAKGQRLLHSPFRLVSCALCVTMPAKLQCTFTDKSLCHQCYAMKHIKVLPMDGRENQPRRIDYFEQYRRYAEFADTRAGGARGEHILQGEDDSYEAVLSTDWHPFYDARGVKYFHNFNTGERMRQSPEQVPNEADPGADAPPMALEGAGAPPGASPAPSHMTRSFSPGGNTSFSEQRSTSKARGFGRLLDIDENAFAGMQMPEPLALSGFDSLETGAKSRAVAAGNPVARDLRPPFREHMPDWASAA